MEVVYVQKLLQYIDGKFHGLDDNGKAVKTLLCVMIKIIAGNYRDSIVMALIVNIINADILYKVSLNVLKVVSNVGFNVTYTMTDGHSSIMSSFLQSYLKVYFYFCYSTRFTYLRTYIIMFETRNLLSVLLW